MGQLPYSLVGHEMRRPEHRAVELLIQRWAGERPDTCALDMAERGVDDKTIGRALDISGERVAQVAAEAAFRLRRALRLEVDIGEKREQAAARIRKEWAAAEGVKAMIKRCSDSDMTDDELAAELGCNVDTVRQYRCR